MQEIDSRVTQAGIGWEGSYQWIAGNKPVINKLELLLGKVRKIENSTENRHYNPKTDIVKKALESGDSGHEQE